LSTTRKAGKVAIGLFLMLSIIVFGSILYVGYVSVNTEIVVVDTGAEDVFTYDRDVSHGEYLQTEDSNLGIRRGTIELVPDRLGEESPVIREPRPVEPKEPIVGTDVTPRGPPVIREPSPGNRLEPGHSGIFDPLTLGF